MDTEAFRVDIEITSWPHRSRLSSLNEVIIFLKGHVEQFSLDETGRNVGPSLGSKPDPSFGDHRHSLDLENFRPNHVFQRVGNELHNHFLSRLISDRILAESQRTYLPKGRPLFMMVNVELTRKEYAFVFSHSASSTTTIYLDQECVEREQQDSGTEETCAICLEDMSTETKIKLSNCDHPFHVDCIRKWLDRQHNSCPLCRQAIRGGKTILIEASEIVNSGGL